MHGRLGRLGARLALAVLMSAAVTLPRVGTAATRPAGTWQFTGSMVRTQPGAVATLLQDGRVLLTGGLNSNTGNMIVYTQVYDPGTATWSISGRMDTGRDLHTATMLNDGRVLVAGGYNTCGDFSGNCDSTESAEIWDPSTGQWSTTGELLRPTSGQVAMRLPDGRVMIAGGSRCELYGRCVALKATEIYDPASGTWSAGPDMPAPQGNPYGVVLADGNFFVYSMHTAALYDTSSATWSSANGNPIAALPGAAAVALSGGAVLATGGTLNSQIDLPSSMIYYEGSDRWNVEPRMHNARTLHVAVVLSDGSVLVAGGCTTTAKSNACHTLASAEVMGTQSYYWTLTGQLNTARYGATGTLLHDGCVLVAGGTTVRDHAYYDLTSAEIYTP